LTKFIQGIKNRAKFNEEREKRLRRERVKRERKCKRRKKGDEVRTKMYI
jgi:hypothetical protein